MHLIYNDNEYNMSKRLYVHKYLNFDKGKYVECPIENHLHLPVSRAPRGALHKKVNTRTLGGPYYPPF